MSGKTASGLMLFSVNVVLFVAGLLLCGWMEQGGNVRLAHLGVEEQLAATWKARKFVLASMVPVLAAVVTSNGATGSVNPAHDSYTPLGAPVPIVNIAFGRNRARWLGTACTV